MDMHTIAIATSKVRKRESSDSRSKAGAFGPSAQERVSDGRGNFGKPSSGGGTPIPGGFQPTKDDRAFAKGGGFVDGDFNRIWAQFVAHHASKGTRSYDWHAEFRKYVCNRIDMRAGDFNKAGSYDSEGNYVADE
jgi:hypothetical protein